MSPCDISISDLIVAKYSWGPRQCLRLFPEMGCPGIFDIDEYRAVVGWVGTVHEYREGCDM